MSGRNSLPPLPSKYRGATEFNDDYELRTGLLGLAVLEGSAGAALVFFGLYDHEPVLLIVGIVLLAATFIGGLASGFLEKPRGPIRSVLGELPLLTFWLGVLGVLAFAAYAFAKVFLMFEWSLVVGVIAIAVLAWVSVRLGILDHTRLHSPGFPIGQNHPVILDEPMPPDPVRHREVTPPRRD